jgi:hypothetical protein
VGTNYVPKFFTQKDAEGAGCAGGADKVKSGKSQMDAGMEVMKKYEGELKKLV